MLIIGRGNNHSQGQPDSLESCQSECNWLSLHWWSKEWKRIRKEYTGRKKIKAISYFTHDQNKSAILKSLNFKASLYKPVVWSIDTRLETGLHLQPKESLIFLLFQNDYTARATRCIYLFLPDKAKKTPLSIFLKATAAQKPPAWKKEVIAIAATPTNCDKGTPWSKLVTGDALIKIEWRQFGDMWLPSVRTRRPTKMNLPSARLLGTKTKQPIFIHKTSIMAWQ